MRVYVNVFICVRARVSMPVFESVCERADAQTCTHTQPDFHVFVVTVLSNGVYDVATRRPGTENRQT